MPRVKIDYVVSFSSEDPEHPASNLLAWEVSKKKWLCKKGESSCSVVLQLTKAVKISSVHIGVHHAALVEVLVGRSEKGSEQYQVLVPSCVFVPPTESRRDAPAERVRSFSAEQLTADTRQQRWDRVKVVCSQPYNKHCKYGLSFIHIDEPGDAAPTPAVPPRLFALDTFSSDEEESFKPGELFAKHSQKNSDSQSSNSDTGAQIRQATSQALKNIPDTSTKLMKTPISKPNSRKDHTPTSENKSDRTRDTLLYTDEDEKPHTKIDQVVQRHKEQKDKEDKAKQVKIDKKDDTKARKRAKSATPPLETPNKKVNKYSGDKSEEKRTDDRRKRMRVSSEETEQVPEESPEPHTILKGVVLVLSGYENPQRANVRNTALALGARVERDWGGSCTHLICAFPNTPKLRAVRSAGGTKVPVVLAEWVLECSRRRRLLPWQWYATEPKYRQPEPPMPKVITKKPRDKTPPRRRDSDTDCDTDDEIEKVIQKQKAKQLATKDKNVTPPSTPRTIDIDEGPPTDEETIEDAVVPQFGGALPNFFDGYTFVIDPDVQDVDRLVRYVKAYGGLVLQLSELDDDSTVDYFIPAQSTTKASVVPTAQRVSPAWLARCHAAGALLPPD